ncbi:hypothetical protein HK405_005339 [Cladochytrium tenue]|nr:hypothetical protein HK405_005339 [Cladochytrium tenue]
MVHMIAQKYKKEQEDEVDIILTTLQEFEKATEHNRKSIRHFQRRMEEERSRSKSACVEAFRKVTREVESIKKSVRVGVKEDFDASKVKAAIALIMS